MALQTIDSKSRIIGRLLVKAFGLSARRDNLAYYVLIKKQIFILKLNTKDPVESEKLKRLSNKLVLISGTIINQYILIATSIKEITDLRS